MKGLMLTVGLLSLGYSAFTVHRADRAVLSRRSGVLFIIGTVAMACAIHLDAAR